MSEEKAGTMFPELPDLAGCGAGRAPENDTGELTLSQYCTVRSRVNDTYPQQMMCW